MARRSRCRSPISGGKASVIANEATQSIAATPI
jgi:hypothetical protein